MKQRVLFVCLGNICRSPAANGILEKMVAERGLQDRIEVDSAGTYPGHRGELPDPRMRRAAAERGYDLTHRARTVSEDDYYNFDMIIVMDDGRISEMGDHQYLMEHSEIYRDVYESQQEGGEHRWLNPNGKAPAVTAAPVATAISGRRTWVSPCGNCSAI